MVQVPPPQPKKPLTPYGVGGFFLLCGYDLNYLPFRVMRPTSVARWVTSRPPPVADTGSERKRRGRKNQE